MAPLYTRRGDDGSTALAGGRRVRKDDPRVEAYGDLDEATSAVGAARAFVADAELGSTLEFVQHRLYACCSILAAASGVAAPTDADILTLERACDRFEEATGPLRTFIVPGGAKAAALLHLARTVLRRAERRIVTLTGEEEVPEGVRRFVNRASDLLFSAARYANTLEDRPDLAWRAGIDG